jgi:hypothetical protein
MLEALAKKGDSTPAQPASADVPRMEALRQPQMPVEQPKKVAESASI